MKYHWTLFLAVSIAACTSSPSSQESESSSLIPPQRPTKTGTAASLGLAGYSKVFCSALFVSGREPEEAFVNSGYFMLPEELQDKAIYEIDYDNQQVTLRLGDSLTSRAKYFGDLGCIIMTGDRMEPYFTPVKIETTLPPANQQDWPMGDRNAVATEGYDQDLVREIIDAAFSEGLTAALVVLHKGKIVVEQYANGASPDMQLESWSMGKSLTSTLIGRMVRMGLIDFQGRAPVAAWASQGDPRGEITLRQLLEMSSGLHFTAHRDGVEYDEYLDHMYIYTGAIDAFEFSLDRPLQYKPGTEGRYRNCDPMTLGHIMRQTLGDDYWTFAQRELFDKIGIRKQIMETDPYGNLLLSGYDYGTARNWARLGLLYQQSGEYESAQLLPPTWTSYVSRHSQAWDEPIYGGMFWLNGNNAFDLPQTAYYMAGAGGQRTIIVPRHELVIVRMGHFRGDPAGMDALNRACPKIVELVSG